MQKVTERTVFKKIHFYSAFKFLKIVFDINAGSRMRLAQAGDITEINNSLELTVTSISTTKVAANLLLRLNS